MKKINRVVYLDFDDIHNPLLNAGQARATYEVARRLSNKGYQVTVICSRFPGSKDRVQQKIIYKHIGLGSKFVRLNNLIYILVLPFTVRNLQADVIIECFTAPISTLCSPLFTKIPVIALPSMFAADEFSKKYHFPFHLIEKVGVKLYKYFLPYSEVDSGKMKRMNPTIQYKIVPQGVGREFFTIPHKKPQHILFLGRLDIAQKGIDLLLEAYATCINKHIYPLVIAGHGPDEKKIQNIISSLGLTRHVRLVGGTYGLKKRKIISESLFVAFPSRHDELSLWALEALASGMPVVGFDLPECSWMPRTVSLKAKPFQTAEYGKLLLKAQNKTLNKTMRKEARKFAKQFSWDHVAREFDAFIKYVLQKERIKGAYAQ